MKTVVSNIKADKPTINGRIYPEEVIKKAIEKSKGNPLPVVRQDSKVGKGWINISDTVAMLYNIRYEDDRIVGDIKFVNEEVKKTITEDLQISPISVGTVDENNIVSVQKFDGFHLVLNQEDEM